MATTSSALKRHPIKIVNADPSSQEILIATDRRHLMANIYDWLKAYLNLKIDQFTLIKHFGVGDTGYVSLYAPYTTVSEGCGTAVSLSVELQTPSKADEKPESKQTTERRSERPLRIVSSLSES
uniref:Uncharacterized protein n=1 Tax=Steinernema glaseri TaxID=37863 RepID=A0A1I7Y631_9BILA